MNTCETCSFFKIRYNNRGDMAYSFCTKGVSQSSITFGCVWHTKETK